MRILFVESRELQCPNIPLALNRMGHKIMCYSKSLEEIEDDGEKELENFLKNNRVELALSVVYTHVVAKSTYRLNIEYAIWCMDSPAYPAWVPEAKLDNCYFFYFDKRECKLRQKNGQHNAYHLPLAADIVWGGQLVITDEEIRKYACNMSFVGGLYSGNIYDKAIGSFSANIQNAFSDMIERSAFVWDGQDRLCVPQELVEAVRELTSDSFNPFEEMSDEYLIRTYFLGQKLTHVERTLLMEMLAQKYDIHLYTRDTEYVPEGVKRFPPVDAGDGALKVFRSSKINLNITLRSIASGVPARIFDVMSVGGFTLSNWQEEIPELFVEGKEIATYKTPEELVDKADYYLRHDNERAGIAVNGYRKVKEQHTYEHRLAKMISIIQGKGR